MKGIPYFYIIRHKPTKKYYAGCKINSLADSSNFMKKNGYKTTSKIVKNLIEKDGLESFEILRVRHFESSNQALDYESRFLIKVNAAENIMFLNLHNGGKNFVNKGGYNLSESTKEKMRKPKSKETIEKQNNEKRNRSRDVYDKMVESRKQNGLAWHNEESIAKIKAKTIARFENEETKKQHSNRMKEYHKTNPITEETKRKLREMNLGEKNKMFGKTHNEITREKMRIAWVKRKERMSNNEK